MKLRINVYLTTRLDPVDDLDTIQSFDELSSWKSNIKDHTVKIFGYDQLDDLMIKDLMNFTIQECYAVIAYPPEGLHEANEVGRTLLHFLRNNSGKLNWKLKETGLSSVSVEDLVEDHPFIDVSILKLWENFTYGLISDRDLKGDEYEIDIEFVVESDKDEQ